MTADRVCVLGLGNPGAKYNHTRHNIGFDWADRCVESLTKGLHYSERFDSEWCEVSLDRFEVHFLKPQTFMNLSGKALQAWCQKYQGPKRILAVFDDLDLPLGRIRLRGDGSDGGHRGLRSLLQLVPNEKIDRLKLGVGRPDIEAVEHVLGKFNPEEKEIVSKIVSESERHLKIWLENSLDRAMNLLNGVTYSCP